MFCYQCEQTAKGEGCTAGGVCGKQPDVAALQDLLLYAAKGLSQIAVEGGKVGVRDEAIDRFVCEATFSTLTNVDFDAARFVELIDQAVAHRDALKIKVDAAGGWTDFTDGPATYVPAGTTAELVAQGEKVGVQSNPDINPDILSLQEIIVYGIKGMAAYADHAAILGQKDDKVFDFIYEGLAATLDNDKTADELLGLVLKCAESKLPGYGTAGCREYRNVWSSAADGSPSGRKSRKSDFGIRA